MQKLEKGEMLKRFNHPIGRLLFGALLSAGKAARLLGLRRKFWGLKKAGGGGEDTFGAWG